MLSLPLFLAAASAGLVGGIHCVGMCGGLAHILATPVRTSEASARVILLHPAPRVAAGQLHSVLLHAGRLTVYALLGGLMGGMGATVTWLAPTAWLQQTLFVLGNLALLLLGLRLLHPALLGQPMNWLRQRGLPLGLFSHLPWQAAARGMLARGQQHPFLLGLAWACLPCGLLYAVLPFALLSGAAWSGAILMLVFGLSSLPHLLLASSARQWGTWSSQMRPVLALLLLGLGVFGLLHYDMREMPQWLCITAPR